MDKWHYTVRFDRDSKYTKKSWSWLGGIYQISSTKCQRQSHNYRPYTQGVALLYTFQHNPLNSLIHAVHIA
jgi:hypothetical protein